MAAASTTVASLLESSSSIGIAARPLASRWKTCDAPGGLALIGGAASGRPPAPPATWAFAGRGAAGPSAIKPGRANAVNKRTNLLASFEAAIGRDMVLSSPGSVLGHDDPDRPRGSSSFDPYNRLIVQGARA